MAESAQTTRIEGGVVADSTADLQPRLVGTIVSLAIVFVLALAANRLTIFGRQALGRELIEYPLWAAGLGLVANAVLTSFGVRDWLKAGFRTELFLKTGLVILGATINFADILRVGVRGLLQAVILVTGVFFFAWYVSRAFRLDAKLRAVLCTSVAICGVSAAIAAAGAVLARREHLAYVTTLVILFALPLMLLMPLAARLLGLPSEVAGAWIGGNIDTTAAVVGAGAIHGEQAMRIATIVKLSQNALIGFAAFFLALYWVLVVEGKPQERPSPLDIWRRFPKFVIGFVLASLITTVGLSLGYVDPGQVKTLTNLRNWFLTLAFVSIGLDVSPRGFLAMGVRPVAVFSLATVFNTLLALGIAWLIFGGLLGL